MDPKKFHLPYFPRDGLLRHVLAIYASGLKQAVTLSAPGRKGKTSFITNELLPAARDLGWQTINIDLSKRRSEPELVLVEALEALLDNTGPTTVQAPEDTLENRLHAALTALVGDGATLLVLDEVQALAGAKREDFVASLRTVIQQLQGKLLVFYTGSSREGLNSMFRQQKAPLFASALPLHLEDLGEDFIEDRLAFLRERSPVPVSKEGLSDAFERMGKSPEFLNEVILHLIIGGNGDIEQAMENWWKSHPDAGRNVIDLDHGEARVFHQSRACLLKHWALFKRTSESAPAYAVDRVHAALLGEFDANQLNIDEERIFMEALAEYMSQPYAEGQALAAKMYREGGYVGDDENGRLVRTLPGGGTEAIE